MTIIDIGDIMKKVLQMCNWSPLGGERRNRVKNKIGKDNAKEFSPKLGKISNYRFKGVISVKKTTLEDIRAKNQAKLFKQLEKKDRLLSTEQQ